MGQITSIMLERIQNQLSVLPLHWVSIALSGVLGLASVRYGFKLHMCRQMQNRMRQRADRSRANIEKLRDSLKKVNVNTGIIQLSFQELQRKLQNGDLTPTEVLRAYQSEALKVNDKTNAITDTIEIAGVNASRLDSVSPDERGPLHGIPISVKESMGLKGQDCTSGFGELIDIPKPDDSVTIKVLKAKGAIPFVRTNLPQAMRSIACENPIYGETVNPLDPQRSPGGSSGGEGAIIGGQGSILGVGSDIAGSVRVPAHYCGICALKPTAGRLSLIGDFGTNALGGQKIIPATNGPMGRDVESLVQFMSAILGPELFALDPSLPQMPFRDEIFQSQQSLRIGFYVYDDCVRCVPAVERAVMVAKTVLQNLGHTLVEFTPYKPFYAFNDILIPAIFGDDLDAYRELLKYDNRCDLFYDVYKFQQRSYAVRSLLTALKNFRTNDPMSTSILKRKPTRTILDWFRKTVESRVYLKEFTENWMSQKLDAVICPCMPCAATKPKLTKDLLCGVSYTSLYNVVNYPAGVLPVTNVTASDVTKTMDPAFYKADTALEQRLREDSKGTEGLPIGIQVVALPYMEEVVLRIMSELETALKSDKRRNRHM